MISNVPAALKSNPYRLPRKGLLSYKLLGIPAAGIKIPVNSTDLYH
jgi:hypothetical protein